MPQDPFITPETLGMMKGMYDLFSAAVAAGFPEHVATSIVTNIIVQLLASAISANPQKTE